MSLTFLLAGFWVQTGIDGYMITSVMDKAAPSNPLHKEVAQQAGAWLANFTAYPTLWAIRAGRDSAVANRAFLTPESLRLGFSDLVIDDCLRDSDGRDYAVPIHYAFQF